MNPIVSRSISNKNIPCMALAANIEGGTTCVKIHHPTHNAINLAPDNDVSLTIDLKGVITRVIMDFEIPCIALAPNPESSIATVKVEDVSSPAILDKNVTCIALLAPNPEISIATAKVEDVSSPAILDKNVTCIALAPNLESSSITAEVEDSSSVSISDKNVTCIALAPNVEGSLK
jgi:hypothetical protein